MENQLILQDLSSIYQQLIGASFQATYIGMREMPQFGNLRPVLGVNPFDATLPIVERVSNAVLANYGQTVWKGITGPNENQPYTNYWLWVDPPEISEQLVRGGMPQGFTVRDCVPYPCFADHHGSFSFRVSIVVTIEN